MNCKPGDLAIVILPLGMNPDALGMIVEVLDVVGVIEFEAGRDLGIRIRAPRALRITSGEFRLEALVRQRSLRLIRNPGDDAVDETLLRLPSPRQEVTA